LQALPGTVWRHEEGSEMMLDHLIETNYIDFAETGIDVKLVKDLINPGEG
jgi:hypothetical protein